MDREIKVWGQRWLIRQDSTHATSFLVLRSGHECSWHCHKTKYNLFVVTHGSLEIRAREVDGTIHSVTLRVGECLTVRPGVEHQFRVPNNGDETCTAIEEMYVAYDESDIVRSTMGF